MRAKNSSHHAFRGVASAMASDVSVIVLLVETMGPMHPQVQVAGRVPIWVWMKKLRLGPRSSQEPQARNWISPPTDRPPWGKRKVRTVIAGRLPCHRFAFILRSWTSHPCETGQRRRRGTNPGGLSLNTAPEGLKRRLCGGG